MALPQRRYTLDDYFLIELSSPLKHEYLRGEVFAMSGASIAHNEITANGLTLLRTALRAKSCRAYASDLRVATPAGLLTYPDVAVICGATELLPERPDTATNPTVLIEVLSEATRTYDRGQKFTLYKSIRSLREYVLIGFHHHYATETEAFPEPETAATVVLIARDPHVVVSSLARLHAWLDQNWK